MILKRYILIFTLALISCAGTKYIQTISVQEPMEMEDQEMRVNFEEVSNLDVIKVERAKEEFQLS